LPQVEINIAYPSRRHLPAKVRTFIDHLVEHFNQTPNSVLGEQWIKDGLERPATSAPFESAESRAPEAFDGAEPLSRLLDSELSPVVPKPLAKSPNLSTRPTALSPL
jgi:hypothetical protein